MATETATVTPTGETKKDEEQEEHSRKSSEFWKKLAAEKERQEYVRLKYLSDDSASFTMEFTASPGDAGGILPFTKKEENSVDAYEASNREDQEYQVNILNASQPAAEANHKHRDEASNSERGGSTTGNRIPSLDNFELSSQTSGRQMVGSRRVVKEKDIKERELWVYLVALCMLLATTAGLGCVVFLVFGAAEPQIDYQEALLVQVESLSEDPAVFEEASSAQSLALNWLAHDDEAKVDPDDRIRVQTRYSLAVLYFATNGATTWIDTMHFLTPSHECYWNNGEKGAFCDSENNLVQDLIIGTNNLRGWLPVELSAISSLKRLNLEGNRLTGTFPSFQFAELESMVLDMNFLEGSLPGSLGSLTQLKDLHLSSNMLTSSLPSEIRNLAYLETLSVGHNMFSGLGADFEVLTNLRHINITKNSFEGDLHFLGNLPFLVSMDLSLNEFEADLSFEKFSSMTNLEIMVLSHNQIVGPIPSSFGKLTRLRYFDVTNNLLTGQFPWSAFPQSKLRKVAMGDNLLTGLLPLDIYRFESLEVLDLSSNHLSGPIPLGIGGVSMLMELRLAANSLSGAIPPSLGNLVSLDSLDISDNNLVGSVPEALSYVYSLRLLDLHGNHLSGSLPEELGRFGIIERIVLQENNITGDIDFLCNVETTPIISADCGGIDPKVVCTCCEICLQ
jgi:Leucine-rich repeat (LRR) protein